MPCGHFEDAAEHRLGVGHPEERQILVKRLGVEFGLDPRNLQQRLDFGRKRKAFALSENNKRLDAEVIAGHEQRGSRFERRSQMAKANMPFKRFTQSVPSCS